MNPRVPFAAFALLTAIPVPRWAFASPPLAGAAAAFPLVGAALGLALVVVDTVLRAVLPVTVVTAVDLVLLGLVTGGLHLDGLADTADGLGAGPGIEDRLAAMRDIRIGAFGASAVVLVLLVEYAALSSLDDATRAVALVAALALSRWAMAIALWAGPAARADGVGAAFASGTRTSDALVATAATGVVVGLTTATPLAAVTVALLVLGLSIGVARRRFGGLTGDTCGAIGELVFACGLVALSARSA